MKNKKRIFSFIGIALVSTFVLGFSLMDSPVQAKTSKVRSSRKAPKRHKKAKAHKVPSVDNISFWGKKRTVITTRPVTVKEIQIKAFPVYLNRVVLQKNVLPKGTKLQIQNSADEGWIVEGANFPTTKDSFWSVQRDSTNWLRLPKKTNKKYHKAKKHAKKVTKKSKKAHKKSAHKNVKKSVKKSKK